MIGNELKIAGQARAVKRAGSQWLADALVALKHFCTEEYVAGLSDVTIDNFREAGRVREPANANAWGALPKAAIKAGYLKPTERTEAALRPAAHSRRVRVWDIAPEAL
ncbi:hypothetical protein ACQUFY_05830 [Robbsia andropogonis]|uniref:hypothetical protein n=1 Tax=Robbsia andropogonis TaxID=28092 RepID=UPI003D1E883D